MNIKESTLALMISVLVMGCGPTLYSKKELRTQTVPEALKNKTWILREIHSEKVLDATLTNDFNKTNGTENCLFTFQFADKGELKMSFKDHNFKGIYLVEGDKFKLVYSGFREKIVWTTNPECKITPTQLGYILNWNEFEFVILKTELTMKNKTGDTLLMTTTI
jgi:hypothetical protein